MHEALTQAALPHLRPGSAAVFVSSTVAHAGFSGYCEYTATKGAAEAMPRGGPGRPGEAEDIAAAVAFLLSPLSAYVVGATSVADGGWIAQ